MHFNNLITENMKIGKKKINESSPTFIIAELSCNHRQDYKIAVETIKAMKDAGADCVKLQTLKPETITINSNKKDFVIDGGTLWDGRTLYDLYKETQTPWEWHKPLKELTESLGMEFMSSPFDIEAVEFLNDLGVPSYKIASFEITDIPLIKAAASKGKPIIISTGIALEEDILDAIEVCLSVGNNQIALLKCTSAYPTPLEEVNLKGIQTLKEKFNCVVGISDHTEGSLVPVGATALGGKIIEKHFILNRDLGGPDATFSMEPKEFKKMVQEVRRMEKALGNPELIVSKKVEKNRQFARSLYIVKDIKNGEKLTLENVRSIRPGYGMKPKYYEDILGKTVTTNLEKGTPLSFKFIKE